MPVRSKRELRAKRTDGLSDAAYQLFSHGPFFGGQDFERETTEEERAAIWKKHRAAIIARYREECRPGTDRRTWGEVLEDLEGPHGR